MATSAVRSGIEALDDVLQGLRLGDNVVWQVDELEDYLHFARPFAERAIEEGRDCVYLRFAPHAPVVEARDGLKTIQVDPSPGFDFFSGQVHKIIEEHGREVFYVFDNLSALVEEWATDELLANFFQVTCPYLFELDTLTYFALTRGRHAYGAVARIRDTTQILIDVYRVDGNLYLHPLKVWDRYSPQMFLPHRVAGKSWAPIFHSGDAAAVSSSARRRPLGGGEDSIAPWESVYAKLTQYRGAPERKTSATPELAALKQELTRMLIGSHPEFNLLADRYLMADDLFTIRDRVIGSGRIGGKAAGMLLARRMLATESAEICGVMEDHDSFYVGSDVFFTFLVNNDLFRTRLQLSRNTKLTHEEFDEVERRFLTGRFPPAIVEQFRSMLDYFGQAPIIVRSSSLLEDSFGNAFAGKYRSEFCANQGSPEERLEAFLNAVKLVYASALNPDALSYRRKRGLGENEEQMAILVQRVSGMPYRRYFFPMVAGVAFSRNLYAWSDRIDAGRGVIRMVFGLGTRAVDRVGGDYPRMIAISHPELRPEVGARIAKYSQHYVDVLNLESNQLATLPTVEVLEPRDYPNLHLLVSVVSDGYVRDPISRLVASRAEDLAVTFNNLIRRTKLVSTIGNMLSTLENAYGHPVDVEFTASVDRDDRIRVNLLQCRPLWLPGDSGVVSIPSDIPRERVLFRSHRMISGGLVKDIRYILYIGADSYAAVGSVDRKMALGRVVGRINEHPNVSRDRILMMGPGRWGSSNIDLGVNVGYADIDNASVLVEIAREEAGHVPEVSYGTHFFQDLVEAQIIYLPIYPGDAASGFNSEFFASAPNSLSELLPDAAEFEQIIHLIDVPAVTGGAYAQVAADPQGRLAVCYLEGIRR